MSPFVTAAKLLRNLAAELHPEYQRINAAFKSAPGQDLVSAKGTAWGLVNAVTHYVDHIRANKSRDARLDCADENAHRHSLSARRERK
jgi:hypothetical protein